MDYSFSFKDIIIDINYITASIDLEGNDYNIYESKIIPNTIYECIKDYIKRNNIPFEFNTLGYIVYNDIETGINCKFYGRSISDIEVFINNLEIVKF